MSAVDFFLSQHRPALAVTLGYLVGKATVKWFWRGNNMNWDWVCFIHNIVSVLAGLFVLGNWDADEASSCGTLSRQDSLILLLQAAHCLTDFVVYFWEMVGQPVFIFHHAVILVVSTILPHCPGCFFTVIAFTIAEFGSGAVAVDALWRAAGGFSRGWKRLVVFGATRVVNLYLLYRIWLVTPSTMYFTITNEGEEVMTVNFPICMITACGGSIMMLVVNGVTWHRMLRSFQKRGGKVC